LQIGGAVPRRAAGQDPPIGPGAGIWVADTLGDLGLLFRLAPVVFIGGSLVTRGGQNPLEPARLGCAVAVGPNTQNHAGAVEALRAAGAVCEVADGAALADFVAAMLGDAARRTALGEAGQAAASAHDGLPAMVAERLVRASHAGP